MKLRFKGGASAKPGKRMAVKPARILSAGGGDPCPDCHGTGKISGHECGKCHGTGHVPHH